MKKTLEGILTLTLALLSAGITYTLHLPLPWMIGPLFFFTLLSTSGIKFYFPMRLKEPVFALVGIYLGSSIAQGGSLFDPIWIHTFLIMVFFTVFATFAGFIYFNKIAHYGQKEAFLSALPGALAFISSYIIENNLPPARIILAQSIRVLLVIGLAPFVYQWITGSHPNAINELPKFDTGILWLWDLAILVLLSIPMIWVWLKLNAPNSWFLGGMIASMMAYLTGVTDQQLPTWILKLLLVMIGTMIGLRFADTSFRNLLKYAFHGFNATVILLIITFLVSYVSAVLLDTDIIQIFLAFAPGGVHEMAIIAFSYSISPIFVTFHHILRIFVVSFLIPLIINRLK